MANIIYEADTYFEHLRVIHRESTGSYVVQGKTHCENAQFLTAFTGNLEQCINFVKEEKRKAPKRSK